MWDNMSQNDDQHVRGFVKELKFMCGVTCPKMMTNMLGNVKHIRFMCGVTCPKMMTNMLGNEKHLKFMWGSHVAK